jgi:hypothetical protein
MSKRGKAALQDVRTRVNYAFCSGDHTVPYEKTDKRYVLFIRELGRTVATDHDFRDMCEVYGEDLDALAKKQYPHPGPVVAYEELRYTPVRRFPGDSRL